MCMCMCMWPTTPGDHPHLNDYPSPKPKPNPHQVTILNDDVVKNRASSVLETRLNRDKMQAGMADWKKQFQDAIQPGAEDDEPPGVPQYIIHAITVIFKVSP